MSVLEREVNIKRYDLRKVPYQELELPSQYLSESYDKLEFKADPLQLPHEQQRRYHAWVEWLKKEGKWQWFGVQTFDDYAPEYKARNAIKKFVRRHLFARKGFPRYIAVLDQCNGHFHIHILVQQFKTDKEYANAWWQEVFGFSWFSRFENTRGGIEYLAIKIARNQDYLIFSY
jgi:hypothetical protein